MKQSTNKQDDIRYLKAGEFGDWTTWTAAVGETNGRPALLVRGPCQCGKGDVAMYVGGPTAYCRGCGRRYRAMIDVRVVEHPAVWVGQGDDDGE